MIFEEETVQMAKELAREMVRLEKEKNRETILTAWEDFKNGVIEIWNSIKEAFTVILQPLSETKEHNHNWYVPRKIVMNHQVLDRMPTVPHMRNRL